MDQECKSSLLLLFLAIAVPIHISRHQMSAPHLRQHQSLDKFFVIIFLTGVKMQPSDQDLYVNQDPSC